MPILLERGGSTNIPTEVQRWQYFLLTRGFTSVGTVDADFGSLTEGATKDFQAAEGIAKTGKLDVATHARAVARGYRDLNASHYSSIPGTFPQPPAGLSSPSNSARNSSLGCFKFRQRTMPPRNSREDIDIEASCDGTVADWEATNIVFVTLGDLAHVPGMGTGGRLRVHRALSHKVTDLIAAWKAADLLHLVIGCAGAFNARYKRGTSGLTAAGHGTKRSDATGSLSNHSWGSAFDINVPQNPFGGLPARIGRKGCVRELVPIANAQGWYWGGHFTKRDGMHFEFAAFDDL